MAVDYAREAKRKLRQTEYDPVSATGLESHISGKYQGRVGNGILNFIISFTNANNYTITIADGYHEGYKQTFESYTLFCNFLKANQYDPSKE